METTPPQVLALVLGVVAAFTGGSLAIQLPVEPTQSIAQELQSDNLLPSEITSSVNQMLSILNESSTAYSLHEAALAQFKAAQEDARNELHRNLEMALMTIQEKKEAALDEVTEKIYHSKAELDFFRKLVVNELMKTKQHIQTELNAAKEATPRIFEATVPGKKFQLHRGSFTHKEAMAACKRKGGRIAVPENEQEDDELLRLVNDYPRDGFRRYWIGVDDVAQEGVWVDSNTGLPINYTNFGDGEPNSYEGEEDCVVVETTRRGWNDSKCPRNTHGYLCEFSIEVLYT